MQIGHVATPNCRECLNKAFCKYYDTIQRKIGYEAFDESLINNISSIIKDDDDMSAFTVTVKCIHYSDSPSLTIKRPTTP